MKNLTILGSTGSIGCNALEIVKLYPDRFNVVGLAAKTSVKKLSEQIAMFSPLVAVVHDKKHAEKLKSMLPRNTETKVLYGENGYAAAACHKNVDMMVGAMVGSAGLMPTLAAMDAGKDIALANKETLVMAGRLVMEKVRETNVDLLPVDSEHSAVFQSISGHRVDDLESILLTASGGPFLNRPLKRFHAITPKDALDHPNWDMGRKISIDSATMMNKGLEVIEARWLFDMPLEKIKVLIHPQSIVHSMVTYKDGAVISQMGVPDMKGAIGYALAFPERLDLGIPAPDFPKIGPLTFQSPDLKKFPCLALAYDALNAGGTMPAVLNAANEIAVQAFLDGLISFVSIHDIIKHTMKCHTVESDQELTKIIQADLWARETALTLVHKNEYTRN